MSDMNKLVETDDLLFLDAQGARVQGLEVLEQLFPYKAVQYLVPAWVLVLRDPKTRRARWGVLVRCAESEECREFVWALYLTSESDRNFLAGLRSLIRSGALGELDTRKARHWGTGLEDL